MDLSWSHMMTQPLPLRFWSIGRITGLLLLIVTITHMAGFQISTRFMVAGDFAATSANIAKGETLFRAAALSYSVSSILSVALAVCFYMILEPIHRFSALLVLGWRFFEAVVSSGAWANRFALIDNQTNPNLLGPNGAEALHQLLRSATNASFDIGAIGLALASVIGFVCLFRAQTIPRILSAFAVLGGFLVLGTSVIGLLWPKTNIPSDLSFAVTLLSQLAIGAWLLAFSTRPSTDPATP
jgi:lipid-A-disaccharide synthase-like uncharacterized protein